MNDDNKKIGDYIDKLLLQSINSTVQTDPAIIRVPKISKNSPNRDILNSIELNGSIDVPVNKYKSLRQTAWKNSIKIVARRINTDKDSFYRIWRVL